MTERVSAALTHRECAETSDLADIEGRIWWSHATALIDCEYRGFALGVYVYRNTLSDSAHYELVKKLSWSDQWECIVKDLVQIC